ncbi:MAG: Stp1/IreP family PP2C-type Ser/Thr phosphatase [Acidobacteriota bacterium]
MEKVWPAMVTDKLVFDVCGLTNKGRVRDHNEDCLVLHPEGGLYAVCDGMGGHAGGEVASSVAAKTITDFILNRKDGDWPYGRQENQPVGADLLRNAALLANQRIFERIQAEPWLARMGTTMVSALVNGGGEFFLANVGDSRAYLWRGGTLRQLTSDHSWVNEQVQQGTLSPSEAERHPLKNVITRALGAREALPIDLIREQLEAGDGLLLCSDGLTGMLPDAVIARILAENGQHAASICRQLVAQANQAGGEDNISVILLLARRP